MEPVQVNWKELQNGSDIRGIALEGIAGEHVNLTPLVVESIAKAFVKWLSLKLKKESAGLRIGIGHDSRLSGPELANACFQGLLSSGAEVFDCGLASTPAMFMSTIFEETGFDGAIMLTASHLPFNRNGLKFFTAQGGLDKPDITQILNYCEENSFVLNKSHKPIQGIDLMEKYSLFLADSIRKGVNDPDNYTKPLHGFHIVVDAGNGSGGFFAERVLKSLGADISGSQFLDPDGNFPNHIPNPEDKTAMASISQAVIKNKADLGIIFDTDVDRAAVVDKFGNEINRNKLIGLISSIILEEHPGTTIVTDSITSDGLTRFIEKKLNGIHHRFKRGYKNVINESVRLNVEGNESWVAIETSGHAALKENYFLDDGAFLITKILIKAARLKRNNQTIDYLLADLALPAESEEFRIKIVNPSFKEYGSRVISDLQTFVTSVPGWNIVPKNYEGIRIACDENSGNGWFLLRLSLHDPVIPLNVESEKKDGVFEIALKLHEFFKQYSELDFKSLTTYIHK